MPKTASFFVVAAIAVLLYAGDGHADLVPPGGEGVGECRNKKAGDTCQNFLLDEAGQHQETGICVEEKLDHLHFKFKAHLRCVSASVPFASAAAKKPPVPAADTPSAPASNAPAPTVPPSTTPTPTPPATAAAEPPKSSACALAVPSTNSVAMGVFLFGLTILASARRRRR